ncbi:hypothetical protein D3C87_2174050 [compost metagenome]
MEPSLLPLQFKSVTVAVVVSKEGCVMATIVDAMQPFASFAITLYVPAVRFEK